MIEVKKRVRGSVDCPCSAFTSPLRTAESSGCRFHVAVGGFWQFCAALRDAAGRYTGYSRLIPTRLRLAGPGARRRLRQGRERGVGPTLSYGYAAQDCDWEGMLRGVKRSVGRHR